MVQKARSNSQLANVLLPRIQEAVDYVTNKIYEENKEIVTQVVYEAYFPTMYNRTGELKESWKTNSIRSGNHIKGEFTYDPSKLTVGSTIPNSENYGQHISIVKDKSVVDGLAAIVYQGISDAVFGPGPWTKPRDAWSKLVNSVGPQKISNWMKEGLEGAGLKVARHKVGIGR